MIGLPFDVRRALKKSESVHYISDFHRQGHSANLKLHNVLSWSQGPFAVDSGAKGQAHFSLDRKRVGLYFCAQIPEA